MPNFYYITEREFEPSRPLPKDNLIEMYGLTDLAASVARVNPDGTKGVKLRKLYKSHILDLPGKHVNINTDHDVTPIVFRPQYENDPNDLSKVEIKTLPMDFLLDKLNFDRTPDTGIPDFDVTDLAVSDLSLKNGEKDGKKRKKAGSVERDVKRSKK